MSSGAGSLIQDSKSSERWNILTALSPHASFALFVMRESNNKSL